MKQRVPRLLRRQAFVRRGQSHGGGQATRQGDCTHPRAMSWTADREKLELLERTRRIPLSTTDGVPLTLA
ncbi:hypothetical protein RTBOTA2_002002, partial [Rhodotorula toruloides]